MLLVIPAPAAAQQPALVAERPTLRGPALAGDLVLAQDGRRLVAFGHGRSVVLHAAAGGAAVDADATGVVAVAGGTLYAGPPLGPLGVLDACSAAGAPAPALDGPVVAWLACRPDVVRVRDGAAVVDLAAGGRVSSVAVRGRRVAWVAAGALHRRVLGAASEEPVVPAGEAAQVVLGEDGTAVLARGGLGCRDAPLVAVAPGAAEAVDLGLRACSVAGFAGGRIVALRRARAAPGAGQLVATSPDRPGFRGLGTVTGADWDGRRLAVTRAGCAADELLVAEGLLPLEPVRCARPAVTDAVLRRDATLRVTVECPDGCRDLAVVAAGRALRGPVTIPPGERELRFPLRRRARGLVRRTRRATVELLLAAADAAPRRARVRVRVP